MTGGIAIVSTTIVGALTLAAIAGRDAPPRGQSSPAPSAVRVRAARLATNPLVTVDSAPSLGDNVNGPSIVRAPAWLTKPLGRYYMYFAHHKGAFVRLASADAIAGPWKVYQPGVLQVRDTAFFRAQPDPPDSPDGFYTHVASPEIDIDPAQRTIVMWVHGWWTNGERWPITTTSAARDWARQNKYGQFTQAAESTDGVHFTVRGPITRESYVRLFRHLGVTYGMARLGRLMRASASGESFDTGPNPFRDGPYADRVRHVALLVRGETLFVFFSGIGDAPERIMLSTVALTGEWETWKASAPQEILRPQAPYECPTLPASPSDPGDVEGRVQQMRDPAVFEENGSAWLFYSICGEQGIAGASLSIED